MFKWVCALALPVPGLLWLSYRFYYLVKHGEIELNGHDLRWSKHPLVFIIAIAAHLYLAWILISGLISLVT